VQEVEKVYDLLNGEGGPGLLTITEGSVGDKDFLGRGDGDDFMVKIDATDLLIGEDIPLQVGFVYILQDVPPEFGVLVI
jgi:hypothetical protein